MEFVHVIVAVFSLVSVGRSAPVSSCEGLIRPLELPGRDQLLGKWMHIAETMDMPGAREMTKMFMDTNWLNLTAAEQADTIVNTMNPKMSGRCISMSYNTTLENNKLVMVNPYRASAVLLSTGCPDCMVVYSNNTIGRNSYSGLQLLSRRPKVSAAELQEFKKQVECVNLPPPIIHDPEKGFCPDPSVSQETQVIDTAGNINSETLNLLDKMLRSDKGLKKIRDFFSSMSEPKITEN
ncbi:uncharacterized protein LOC133450722 [Cololabis saira]|uniref:uncharacterized protein LOC133450722 n=1 Tax=Cololabis saira TaxID=129043 RepID=UPI002AD4A04E|nr:uncharacterized protein LOC133450722 [Cololabis saira]